MVRLICALIWLLNCIILSLSDSLFLYAVICAHIVQDNAGPYQCNNEPHPLVRADVHADGSKQLKTGLKNADRVLDADAKLRDLHVERISVVGLDCALALLVWWHNTVTWGVRRVGNDVLATGEVRLDALRESWVHKHTLIMGATRPSSLHISEASCVIAHEQCINCVLAFVREEVLTKRRGLHSE